MRVLLDTNVVLDLFLERVPFVEEAAAIWKAHEAGLLTAFVSAITPVNLFYIGRKLRGREVAARAVQELVMAVPIAPVNQSVLENSLALKFKDFEDAVQHACASASGVDIIVTRNTADFSGAIIPVQVPGEFIRKQSDLFDRLR